MISVPLDVTNRAEWVPTADDDDVRPPSMSAEVEPRFKLAEAGEALLCWWESGSKLLRLESVDDKENEQETRG